MAPKVRTGGSATTGQAALPPRNIHFNSAVAVLQTLVIALGAGLGIWGAINLLEGYGNDNPGAKSSPPGTTRFAWSQA